MYFLNRTNRLSGEDLTKATNTAFALGGASSLLIIGTTAILEGSLLSRSATRSLSHYHPALRPTAMVAAGILPVAGAYAGWFNTSGDVYDSRVGAKLTGLGLNARVESLARLYDDEGLARKNIPTLVSYTVNAKRSDADARTIMDAVSAPMGTPLSNGPRYVLLAQALMSKRSAQEIEQYAAPLDLFSLDDQLRLIEFLDGGGKRSGSTVVDLPTIKRASEAVLGGNE
jgi:hypothetical protein